MTIDEMIAVLQAAKAGKQIQVMAHSVGEWIDANYLGWNFQACDYRAKLEPREWEVWLSDDGNIATWNPTGNLKSVIKVREVLP